MKKNIIKLFSEKSKHLYIKKKNKKNKKIKLRKFDPIVKKHVKYFEK